MDTIKVNRREQLTVRRPYLHGNRGDYSVRLSEWRKKKKDETNRLTACWEELRAAAGDNAMANEMLTWIVETLNLPAELMVQRLVAFQQTINPHHGIAPPRTRSDE